MLTTAIVNQKGGVGKTTVTSELGTQLALLGKRVLLIDLDPQGNLTSGFGIDKNGAKTFYDLATENQNINDYVLNTPVTDLFILPSNRSVQKLETELSDDAEKEYVLKNHLKNLEGFDYVFLDCPPALGLLSVSALTAADKVMVPLLAEYYALEGLRELLKTVKLVKKYLNPSLTLDGLVFTKFDSRLSLDKYIHDSLKNTFGSAVYKARIPKNVTLAEATGRGLPASIIFKNCKGSEAYKLLAEEFSEKQEAHK